MINFGLDNKIGIVTGASSGIGLAAAKSLASSGARVVGLSRNLQPESSNIEYLKCDVTSKSQIEELANFLKNKYGHIDFLVNCAGRSIKEKQAVVDENNFNALIETNLKSVYLTTMLLAYPLMTNGGSIVNVSSIRAHTGTPSFSPTYSASKSGVIGLSKSFALEMASRNIRVNCVSPGATYPTDITSDWSEEMIESVSKSIPLQRLATPADIASSICYLVSDESSYITGQTIHVNGGALMI